MITILLELNSSEVQLIAAVSGIVSMIVARLLDWYFPIQTHRPQRRRKKKANRDA
jgi:hypothetical protein